MCMMFANILHNILSSPYLLYTIHAYYIGMLKMCIYTWHMLCYGTFLLAYHLSSFIAFSIFISPSPLSLPPCLTPSLPPSLPPSLSLSLSLSLAQSLDHSLYLTHLPCSHTHNHSPSLPPSLSIFLQVRGHAEKQYFHGEDGHGTLPGQSSGCDCALSCQES